MLQRFRESLALVLIALLPFHALGVTVLTRAIAGPGQAPLPVLALWKEALLGFLIAVALVEMLRTWRWSMLRLDLLDGLILALLAISVVPVLLGIQASPTEYLVGFRYDFVPLVAFVMLRRVEWSQSFRDAVVTVIFWAGGIVAAYGIVSFVLPQQFFVWLGYSDLHSLYLPDGPLAAYQQIGGGVLRRIQSTFSGPNQLGLWLLLPWSIALLRALRDRERRWAAIGYAFLIAAALALTFSRSAWIAAVLIFILAVSMVAQRRLAHHLLGTLGGLGIAALVAVLLLRPAVLLRAASSRDHLLRPIEAVKTMIAYPLGKGLGTAGPASNRTSDACVLLEAGADASWAADRPNLCVFVGAQQVQPTDRACTCPFLTENWYLQLGVEMGALGFILIVALTLLMLYSLLAVFRESLLRAAMAFSFLGISAAGFFLHSWEDAAVAYTVWVVGAAVLPRSTPR